MFRDRLRDQFINPTNLPQQELGPTIQHRQLRPDMGLILTAVAEDCVLLGRHWTDRDWPDRQFLNGAHGPQGNLFCLQSNDAEYAVPIVQSN